MTSTLPAARAAIRAEYAWRIRPFLSREETRYYLTGFCIEPRFEGGVYVVATDGHTLGCFYDAYGFATDRCIVAIEKPLRRACKPQQEGQVGAPWLVIHGDAADAKGDVATVVSSYAANAAEALKVALAPAGAPMVRTISQRRALIDGKFPDWRRVVPAPASVAAQAPLSISLDRFRQFRRAVGDGGGMQAWPTGDHGPVLVTTDRGNFFGIVMPAKAFTDRPVPAWFEPAPPPEKGAPPPDAPATEGAA